MTHTSHGTNRYVTLFAVAPAIIMLPDIAHLDLVAGRIAGRIGQNPALEGLHQRPLRHTCDVGTHPIGITDGVTKCHHPIKQLAIAIAPTAIDQPTLIEEGAKHIGDVVTCLGDILRIADVGRWGDVLEGTVAKQLRPHRLAGFVGLGWQHYCHDHPAIASALDQRRKAIAQLMLDNPDPRTPPTK